MGGAAVGDSIYLLGGHLLSIKSVAFGDCRCYYRVTYNWDCYTSILKERREMNGREGTVSIP